MHAVSPASSGVLRTARIARGRVPFFACPKKGTKEKAPPRRRPPGRPWPGPLRPGRPKFERRTRQGLGHGCPKGARTGRATSCRAGTERALHGPFTRSPQPRPWRLQGGSGNPSSGAELLGERGRREGPPWDRRGLTCGSRVNGPGMAHLAPPRHDVASERPGWSRSGQGLPEGRSRGGVFFWLLFLYKQEK